MILLRPTNLTDKVWIEMIDSDIELNDKEKIIAKNHLYKLYYIVHIVIHHGKRLIDKDNGVRIYSLMLREIFGSSKYNFMISFIVRNKILLVDINYSTGFGSESGRSRSYILGEEYKNKKVVGMECKDRMLNDKIEKQMSIMSGVERFIFDNMKQMSLDINKVPYKLWERLSIDSDIVLNNINSFDLVSRNKFDIDFVNNYFDRLSDLLLIEDDETKINVFNNWYMNCSNFLTKNFQQSKGDNSNRIYNNITNMPRDLRKCLKQIYNSRTCKYEDIYSIDISNSQPVLFNKFIMDSDIANETDSLRYMKLTSTGKLFDYLMSKWELDIKRDEFKKLFFSEVFYCNSFMNSKYEYSKLFELEFPSVFKLIKKLKGSRRTNDLPVMLQSLEAKIMIEDLMTDIYLTKTRGNKQGYKGKWCISIHDSILCLESEVGYFKKKLEEHLINNGIVCNIKVDKVNSDK